MKRICIVATGDRNADWQTWRPIVREALMSPDIIGRECILIHGDSTPTQKGMGIDKIAGKVAGMHGVAVMPIPAMWDEYTPRGAAGPARNRDMLKMAEIMERHGYEVRVYAFHDDFWKSTGTKNCVMQARDRSLPVTLFMTNGKTADLSEEED